MARVRAEEEEAGEAERGSERDGERPHEETAAALQLRLSDTICTLCF